MLHSIKHEFIGDLEVQVNAGVKAAMLATPLREKTGALVEC